MSLCASNWRKIIGANLFLLMSKTVITLWHLTMSKPRVQSKPNTLESSLSPLESATKLLFILAVLGGATMINGNIEFSRYPRIHLDLFVHGQKEILKFLIDTIVLSNGEEPAVGTRLLKDCVMTMNFIDNKLMIDKPLSN